MRIVTLAVAAATLVLSGCASKPEDIPIFFYSTEPYEEGTCEQLAATRETLVVEERQLYATLDGRENTIDPNVVIRTVVSLPTLFFLNGGPDPDTTAYSFVKSKLKAVDEVMKDKDCEAKTA